MADTCEDCCCDLDRVNVCCSEHGSPTFNRWRKEQLDGCGGCCCDGIQPDQVCPEHGDSFDRWAERIRILNLEPYVPSPAFQHWAQIYVGHTMGKPDEETQRLMDRMQASILDELKDNPPEPWNDDGIDAIKKLIEG